MAETLSAEEMEKMRLWRQNQAVKNMMSPLSGPSSAIISDIKSPNFSNIKPATISDIKSPNFSNPRDPITREAEYRRSFDSNKRQFGSQFSISQNFPQTPNLEKLTDLKNLQFNNPKEATRAFKSSFNTLKNIKSLKNLKDSDFLSGISQQVGQMATAKALFTAWTAIPETFGLSFLYVIFHWFCRYSHVSMELREYFCPFGSEWMAKTGGSSGISGASSLSKTPASIKNLSANNSTQSQLKNLAEEKFSDTRSSIAEKAQKFVSKGAETIELGAFYLICLLLFLVLLIIVGLFALIVYIAYVAIDGTLWEKGKLLYNAANNTWLSPSQVFAGFKDIWDAFGGK